MPVTEAERSALPLAASFLIQQDWPAYGADQHEIWTELCARRMTQLHDHACAEYLDGMQAINLQLNQMPDFRRINKLLTPRTGWQLTAVSGFMPGEAFFEMLAARQFPTTTWIRNRDSLEYTPEPDIFHDVFGHVPMHAHPVFADFLQQYGELCARLTNKETLERIGRLFWYTVEFGVIRQQGKIKLYGSGLISSNGESTHVIEGKTEIRDFDLDTVLNTTVKVDEFNPILYAIESFDQIYEAMQQAAAKLA
jgi:phenylalanine-4-hydroxylase